MPVQNNISTQWPNIEKVMKYRPSLRAWGYQGAVERGPASTDLSERRPHVLSAVPAMLAPSRQKLRS